MNKNTTAPETLSMGSRDVLTDYLHQGACDMLTKAIEAEVQAYLAQHEHCRDEKGHRLVVREGPFHAQAGTGSSGLDRTAPRKRPHAFSEVGLPNAGGGPLLS